MKQHIAIFNLPQYYSIKMAVVKVLQARLVVINRSGFYQVYASLLPPRMKNYH